MQKKRGQVGLLLLVVLGLVISVVLSIAARSLSDVVLSRQERENSTAFELAETGVETALQKINAGDLTGGSLSGAGDLTGNYAIQEQDSFDLFVRAGEMAEVDLLGYPAINTLQVRWSREGDEEEDVDCVSEGNGNAPASLELIAIKTDNTVSRSYYNSAGCTTLPNGFSNATLNGSSGFISEISYSLPGDTRYLRLRPYYSGSTLRVDGSGLALQMYLVQANAEGGDADKEIEVKRSRDAAGSIFDYALFSGSSIIK